MTRCTGNRRNAVAARGAAKKIIEVIAESEPGWDSAVKNCLSEVPKTVGNVNEIWISSMKVAVTNNETARYRITANVTFLVKGHD